MCNLINYVHPAMTSQNVCWEKKQFILCEYFQKSGCKLKSLDKLGIVWGVTCSASFQLTEREADDGMMICRNLLLVTTSSCFGTVHGSLMAWTVDWSPALLRLLSLQSCTAESSSDTGFSQHESYLLYLSAQFSHMKAAQITWKVR